MGGLAHRREPGRGTEICSTLGLFAQPSCRPGERLCAARPWQEEGRGTRDSGTPAGPERGPQWE